MAKSELLILQDEVIEVEYLLRGTSTSESLVDSEILTPQDILVHIRQTIDDFYHWLSRGVRRNLVTQEGVALASIAVHPKEISVGNAAFDFEAHLDRASGLMDIRTTLTRTESDGTVVRSRYLPHFKDLFPIALNYLGEGSPIFGIKGLWSKPTRRVESTNYIVFNDCLREGLSPEAAALSTPTGKVVSPYGFNNVIFKSDPRKARIGVNVVFKR